MSKEDKENCVFCKILSGEFDCSEIYRDEYVAAFMDIQPINPGHALVIPIKHGAYLENLDPETGAHMFKVGQKIAAALRRSGLKCEGINLLLSDGEAAGQEVWHSHLHIVPRFKGDGSGFKRSNSSMASREDLDEIATEIRSLL